MRSLVCLLILLLMPAAAPAKWIEASSNHFVVYANDRPENVKLFSEKLERYDAAVRLVLGAQGKLPSPSNRVTIYVVRNENEVRRLQGEGSQFTLAFYVPRAGGSLAVVPRIESAGNDKQLDISMIALLHEYAHHVTISLSNFPLPRWFGEGSAEFFSSASFEKDGAVNLGQPAIHRASELFHARDVTALDLLDPEHYEKRRTSRGTYDAFYGKSWLLYHYLVFNPGRKGQAMAYLRELRSGKPAREAAVAAFGDLAVLEKELDSYLTSKMMMLRVPAAGVTPGPVALRELSEGEAAMMPVRIRSKRGVNRTEALALLPEARAVAARYPDDPGVLTALAEAEFDAGNEDAAIAAADKALASDPARVNAYVQKGFALFSKAGKAEDKVAAFRAAMVPFQALNKIEPDHPLPLVYYYLSFTQRRAKPSQLAIDALGKAVELAPFDLGLRAMAAFQSIRDRKIPEAILDLEPIAYNPHAGEGAERFRTLLDKLRAGDADQALALLDALDRPRDGRDAAQGDAGANGTGGKAEEKGGKEGAREGGRNAGGKAGGKGNRTAP